MFSAFTIQLINNASMNILVVLDLRLTPCLSMNRKEGLKLVLRYRLQARNIAKSVY